jgi:peptidoglycan hydrolase-like protein with peptidoglycan-binding domain
MEYKAEEPTTSELYHMGKCIVSLLIAVAIFFHGTPLAADDRIQALQKELRKRHLYFSEIDGRFTPELEMALMQYQKRKGFPNNGVLDDETLQSFGILPALRQSEFHAGPVVRTDGGVRDENGQLLDVPAIVFADSLTTGLQKNVPVIQEGRDLSRETFAVKRARTHSKAVRHRTPPRSKNGFTLAFGSAQKAIRALFR